MKPDYIIELCESASACRGDGEEITSKDPGYDDWMDCAASGDCEPAIRYLRDNYSIEFRIVAKDADGNYENRLATPEEKQEAAEAIYFDSETDFSDEEWAEIYLLWDAACNIREDLAERETNA